MWKLCLGRMGFPLCAIDAHAGKFKMRFMSFSSVGMRGYVLLGENTSSFFRLLPAVPDFLLQHNNKLFLFMSELLDLLLAGVEQPQADQPNCTFCFSIDREERQKFYS
eukprot:1161888-Pelagomonas_calceolata.AAC.1